MRDGIRFEVITDQNIEICRDLCNELMAFQKSMVLIHPECFDPMNFDTRMKKSYQEAFRKHVVVAWDKETPIGYVFSSIDQITEAAKSSFPNWAPKDGLGFYPDWLSVPQNIGCLNNLYLKEGYRNSGLGKKLFDISMEWLEGFEDTNTTFVFISNGNDAALSFYLKNGFTESHQVFGGFITSAYKHK